MATLLVDMTGEEMEAKFGGTQLPDWFADGFARPAPRPKPEPAASWEDLSTSLLFNADRRAMTYRRMCLLGDARIRTLGDLWIALLGSPSPFNASDHIGFSSVLAKVRKQWEQERSRPSCPGKVDRMLMYWDSVDWGCP